MFNKLFLKTKAQFTLAMFSTISHTIKPAISSVYNYLAQGGQGKHSHLSLSPTVLLTNVTNVNDPLFTHLGAYSQHFIFFVTYKSAQ